MSEIFFFLPVSSLAYRACYALACVCSAGWIRWRRTTNGNGGLCFFICPNMCEFVKERE